MRSLPDGPRVSAWLLDISAGGAAALTAEATVPAVGQRVELSEMNSPDRVVREETVALPRYARVLRHDEGSGITRRIALRFESPNPTLAGDEQRRAVTAVCPRPPGAPPTPPPLPTAPTLLPVVPPEWA